MQANEEDYSLNEVNITVPQIGEMERLVKNGAVKTIQTAVPSVYCRKLQVRSVHMCQSSSRAVFLSHRPIGVRDQKIGCSLPTMDHNSRILFQIVRKTYSKAQDDIITRYSLARRNIHNTESAHQIQIQSEATDQPLQTAYLKQQHQPTGQYNINTLNIPRSQPYVARPTPPIQLTH